MGYAKYVKYRSGIDQLPKKHLTWPLYGSGLENLGKNGKPVEKTVPEIKSDELLIRHDAVSLCFTDVKEITFGDQHPRLIGRGLAKNPIVPGHEASMTVVAVGESLPNEYSIGDRFVIQPDVCYGGKSIPYSFGMDGAYRQYAIMGKEILQGDEGSYLIPVPDTMSYAGAALTEPWACVEAAYRMGYRTGLKEDGDVWFLGSHHARAGYRLRNILNEEHKPGRIYVSDVKNSLYKQLKHLAERYTIDFIDMKQSKLFRADAEFDDIIILDGDAEDVDKASQKLAKGGVLAMLRAKPMSTVIRMDFGRVHYDNIVYVGTTGLDIAQAYRGTTIRSSLLPEGKTLIMGSGGPMGRMHLQRALESSKHPTVVVATDTDVERLTNLELTYRPLVKKNSVEFSAVNPINEGNEYTALMSEIKRGGGFDDIEVMVTNVEEVVKMTEFVAAKGTVNIFAGLKRGTFALVDPWMIYGPQQVRFIGHSGSKLNDQIAIIDRFKEKQLQPHRSVAAVCGMNQISDGVKAMMNAVYPGKIVVYPMIHDFPITALPELEQVLPQVYSRLENGLSWTHEAESMFLECLLPE